MRFLRSLVVLVSLCLFLGAAVASAAEAPSAPAGQEAGGVARILDHLSALFKAIWENDAGQIDPWGGNSPKAGAPTNKAPGNPAAEDGCQIDPWG